jgi:peroxiredoxin
MRRVCFLLLLLTVVAAAPALAKAERPQAPPATAVGAAAPDFTLDDLQGNPVTLSGLRGKVVVLNFWASWCPPCRVEMPSMERLNEVFGSRDFALLAVNVEQDAAAVRAFLKENPHSFAVLLDPQGKAQQLYGVYRFPETFLIDKSGRVVEHYLGARDYSAVDFLKKIDALLKE